MLDLAFKYEYGNFREEVRSFIDEHLTEEMQARIQRAEFLGRWFARTR